MELVKVEASSRSEKGKGAARRLRREEKIPAVAYGKKLEPRPVAVSPKQLEEVLHSERGRNTVLELAIDGKDKVTALLADYQYHPVTRTLLHADFIQVNLEEPVDVSVPLYLRGRAHGVVMGGTLRQVFRDLPIRCLPTQIPLFIEHDITALEIDGHVSVRDLGLPEGVSVRYAPERTVAAIVTERKAAQEEAAQKAEEAAAAAEGAAGKPAEGASS